MSRFPCAGAVVTMSAPMARFELIACAWVVGAANVPAIAAPQAPTGQPPPARIITISPNSAEVICALGACDRIVGVDKFCVYPPEIVGKPKVGGLIDPDLEKIIVLRPDLLVLRGRNDALEKLCRSLDVPIHFDRTESLADIPAAITDLGERLGLNERAAALAAEFESRLAAIRKRVAGHNRPRVFVTYSLAFRGADNFANLLTAGKGMFLDEVITIAGGRNVFGDLDVKYPQVSPEAILAKQPEMVIELLPDVELTDELLSQVRAGWQKLGTFPAAGSGRIHVITDDHCLIPSPRYVDIVEKLSRLIHPEVHGDTGTDPPADADRHPLRVPDPP